MTNEHIGRKQSIGLGKEGTPGTEVAASRWFPKLSGSFTPRMETDMDSGAFGVLDAVKEVNTSKVWTEVMFAAQVRDDSFGDILKLLFGSAYACIKIPISGGSGTFAVGETVTESTSLATGVVRRSDQGAATPVLYIDRVTGTFTGGQTLTGGTSSATATGGTIIPQATGRNHVFRLLNNNNHPTATLYGSDPVSDDRAAFCMLESLEIEGVVGKFTTFQAKFLGKQLESTSAQTPVFVAQNGFMARHLTAKMASAFNGLDAASAVNVERFKLTIPKNLLLFYAFGSNSPNTILNQQFGEVAVEMTLLYNAVTQRDLVINSTKNAVRLTGNNTNATAISGSNYPLFQFDMPSVGFNSFERDSDNNNIVKQTIKGVAEFDITRSLTIEALLQNAVTAAY